MNTPNDGDRIVLHGFGPATVRRLCTLDKKELVCDVQADSGELLHLSMRYVQKLMAGDVPVNRAVLTRN